ncbi:MAG: peptide chain release factor-like protein [Planctomycetaceae bacterium]|nr:peptide chain release factor-like protein [Planctomycetaceae bacterium]
MEQIHPAALPLEKLFEGCDVQFLRRSGPGGQHRNKVATAVALRHRSTGIEAEASERRSQAENRSVALARLRVNLALELRMRRELDAGPSPLWKSRCTGGRIGVAATHDDFPAMLAEALDVVAAHGFDARAAAESLGCTNSQLVKFLKKEPRAILWVNAERARLGLHGLR